MEELRRPNYCLAIICLIGAIVYVAALLALVLAFCLGAEWLARFVFS